MHTLLWFEELGRTCGFLCVVCVSSGYGHRAGGEYMEAALHALAAKPAACVVSASAHSCSNV